MRVTVVDCGASNVASVRNMLANVGIDASVAETPDDVVSADRVILPGVGAAAPALERLRSTGLDAALEDVVRTRGRPMLAICLGMQLLGGRIKEFGEHRGLGWIDGEVVPLRDLPGFDERSPHTGWSPIDVAPQSKGLFGRPRGEPSYYFCHSNTLRLADAGAIAATARHGLDLVAAIRFDTVFGCQFHPEKSHVNGQRLFESFLDWTP